MTILITGASGRIGTAIRGLYPQAQCLDVEDIDLRVNVPDFSSSEVVIHLASNLGTDLISGFENMTIAFNVLRGASVSGLSRLIWASSVTAEERHIAFPVTWYGRTKLAQELLLDAWCAEDSRRTAVALRFGHFQPSSTVPPEHEVLRLELSGLAYWIDRALHHQTPGLTIWNALGRLPSNHKTSSLENK